MYILGCTQRECKPNQIIIEQYTKMFESRISAGTNENYPGGKKKPTQRRWRGPTTWKVVLQNALSGSWQTKKVEQLCKVLSPCLDDHQSKQKELESVRELSQVCSQIVLKMLVLGTNWETRHFYGLSTNLQEKLQHGLTLAHTGSHLLTLTHTYSHLLALTRTYSH